MSTNVHKAAAGAEDAAQRRANLSRDWLDARDQLLDEVLSRLNSMLDEAFLTIAELPHIDSVSLRSGDDDHLDLEVAISGTRKLVDPVAILSEANLDLLALFHLCAIAEAAASMGQAQVLVLDDVFQSVDASYRLRAARFLLDRFSGWQLIVLTHDRLWAAELARLFQSNGTSALLRQIDSWSFDSGPVITAADFDPARRVQDAMDAPVRDPVRLAWASGLCLEELCNELSWRLELSITRRRSDRYTLGDLWPATASQLKKCGLVSLVEPVNDHLELRNAVGSHFNDWAQTATVSETTDFAMAVLQLKQAVVCEECGTYVRKIAPKLAVCERGCLIQNGRSD